MRNRLTYDNKVDLIYILLRDSELNKWQFLEVVGQLSAMLRMLIALLSKVERFFVFVFVQSNSPETAGVAVNEAVKCNRLVPLLVGYYMFDSSKLQGFPSLLLMQMIFEQANFRRSAFVGDSTST